MFDVKKWKKGQSPIFFTEWNVCGFNLAKNVLFCFFLSRVDKYFASATKPPFFILHYLIYQILSPQNVKNNNKCQTFKI